MCVLTSSNLKKFSQEKLKASKKAGCCHTSNADTHRQQHAHIHIQKLSRLHATICVSYIAMNLIEISAILHVFVHYSKFLLFFFLYWCKCDNCAFECGGTLTNTCIHIIPCACRALSLTRTFYHLHAQSSQGRNCPCVRECVRVSVGVCHFAISLCFARRAAMFIQWFSISLRKRFFSFLPAIPKMSRTGLSVLRHNKLTPHLLVPALLMLLLLFVTSAVRQARHANLLAACDLFLPLPFYVAFCV